MKIAIRADASNQIGTGHVVRCLALADALNQPQKNVLFLCKAHSNHLANLIKDRGYPVSLLNTSDLNDSAYAHSYWLGGTEDDDAQQSLEAITDHFGGPVDTIILDHYGLAKPWETILREVCNSLVVVDDLSDRKHDCDLLVDQTFAKKERSYDGLLNPKSKRLVGEQFSFLRSEFTQYSIGQIQNHRKNVNLTSPKVIIMMGGMDPDDFTSQVAGILDKHPNLETVSIILSSQAKHLDAVKTWVDSNKKFKLFVSPNNIAQLLFEHDLAIGAFGGSTWERCRMGLPSLSLVIAENQRDIGRTLKQKNICELIDLPINQKQFDSALKNSLSSNIYFDRVNASLNVSDGLGLERVSKEILNLHQGLYIRSADTDDLMTLYAWVNSPERRNSAFNSQEVSLDQHKAWFKSKLSDPNSLIFIAMNPDGDAIGQLRFDIDEQACALVDIYIDKDAGGRGNGVKLLKLGASRLFEEKAVKQIKALVKLDNIASKKSFERSGFTQINSTQFNGIDCYQFLLDKPNEHK